MSNAALSLAIDRLSKASDPKAAILKEIGQDVIDKYRLFNDDVLVGTYIRPEKTAGGIFLTDNSKQEDRFQGKVGLLLKAGPAAFQWDASGAYAFTGEPPQVGDWIVYRPSDGWEMALKGVSCRILRSPLIRGVVDDPSVMW